MNVQVGLLEGGLRKGDWYFDSKGRLKGAVVAVGDGYFRYSLRYRGKHQRLCVKGVEYERAVAVGYRQGQFGSGELVILIGREIGLEKNLARPDQARSILPKDRNPVLVDNNRVSDALPPEDLCTKILSPNPVFVAARNKEVAHLEEPKD
jgi:hypothetical protein